MLRQARHRPAQLAPGHKPVLLVVVDTEEEFRWDRPFDRAQVATTSIAGQPRLHREVYDRHGIVPTYMIDYPVAASAAAVATLSSLVRDGQCEIGTHLHPWVSPPHEEDVNTFNSYAGNLAPGLERAKLATLTATIADAFGRAPTAFKAGRYGVGPATADSIAALGYEIDASVVPYTSFEADGGPDFRAFGPQPYWFEAGGRTLLELPVTGGYCGWLGAAGPSLHRLSLQPAAAALRLGGVLARSRAVERIRLSPESASAAAMERLSRALVAGGERVLTLTYHSPSLAPGHTPYVRSSAELDAFIASIGRYCRFFEEELGGEFLSLSALRQRLIAA